MIVRVLIWSLVDSRTTIGELLDAVPNLEEPSTWIWSDASERFGLIAFGDDVPEAAGWAADLVGGEPEIYEEFDTPWHPATDA